MPRTRSVRATLARKIGAGWYAGAPLAVKTFAAGRFLASMDAARPLPTRVRNEKRVYPVRLVPPG